MREPVASMLSMLVPLKGANSTAAVMFTILLHTYCTVFLILLSSKVICEVNAIIGRMASQFISFFSNMKL